MDELLDVVVLVFNSLYDLIWDYLAFVPLGAPKKPLSLYICIGCGTASNVFSVHGGT
jgi:hypothetical protein